MSLEPPGTLQPRHCCLRGFLFKKSNYHHLESDLIHGLACILHILCGLKNIFCNMGTSPEQTGSRRVPLTAKERMICVSSLPFRSSQCGLPLSIISYLPAMIRSSTATWLDQAGLRVSVFGRDTPSYRTLTRTTAKTSSPQHRCCSRRCASRSAGP
jgi:hypothetical protein